MPKALLNNNNEFLKVEDLKIKIIETQKIYSQMLSNI